MFDTHAHLTDSRFHKERDRVIERAVKEGMSGIICVCSDFKELDVFYHLLDEYDCIYGAVGIHPHDASAHRRLESRLNEALAHSKIVALGEIGLDYYYENSPRDIQKRVFQSQLNLAKQQNLPVIIHSREAMEDTLSILYKEKVNGGVMHCFSGKEEDVQVFLDMGFYISIAGPVTFPRAFKLQNVARFVPLNRLLVETDSPYLAPQPVRGKRNEPLFVKYVIQKIASLREIPEERISQITSRNARKLFKL